MKQLLLKVVACEIAFREICRAAAQCRQLIDLEFLSQGLHDVPCSGGAKIQAQIDAVPAGRYDAILVGYGLCGNLISKLKARHTPLVIPRAHDCITFFVGSTQRYLGLMDRHPGAYYYTSGWLECAQRRGETPGNFLPARAGAIGQNSATFQNWVKKYGEERARALVEVMQRWTENYTHGVWIDFDFLKSTPLRDQVKSICAHQSWVFEEIPGDLSLLQRWLEGDWDPQLFLTVQPGEEVVPAHDGTIISTRPIAPAQTPCTKENI